MKPRTCALLAAVALSAAALAGCGILGAPVLLPAAVAENANFTFAGPVLDQDAKPLEGVIATRLNYHRFWTPIKGGQTVADTRIKRADGRYEFEDRGSNLEFKFTRDGYREASYRLSAEDPNLVVTPLGNWANTKDFPVVMLSSTVRDADLARFNESISYAHYPIADAVALPNLATGARSGDIVYKGKDANDPTIFPPGTLYLTLGKEPPPAINDKGDIDPSDLDIPHHVTLHLPGPGSGLIRITPRVGFHPIATSDQAPAEGYTHEFTLPRARLKAMKQAKNDDIVGAREYFFFRAGDRYGKGTFSWGSGGPPAFRLDLLLQPQEKNRDLTTHAMSG